MRRILLTAMLLTGAVSATFATKITVKVTNFKFSPKTFNVQVGDTIVFTWKLGIHNTTSTTIPAGAAAWAALSDSVHKKFNYVVKTVGTYNFVCTIHAPAMKGTFIASAALSSGVSDVSLSKSVTSQPIISWNTKSEADVAYYSVQRSTDGDNFKEVSRINPSIGSDGIQQHTFTDITVDKTVKYVYYQLQVADKKGNTQLSDIKMFAQTPMVTKLVTSLSPNPISRPGHLMVQFNADKEGSMMMQLYSESGRFIKQAEMAADKGLNNGHFHLGDIPVGTYYVICTMGTTKEKYTIMVK